MTHAPRRVVLAALIALAGAAGLRAEDDLSSVPRVLMEQFKKDLDAGKVLVIDVRSLDTYRAGHIPGAISVPTSALAAQVARLKTARKPIVAYCS